MHHRINIVSLNLVLTKAEPELCSLPPCASFTSVSLAGGWRLRPPSGQEQPQGAARDPRVDRRRGPARSGGGDGGDNRTAPRNRRHRRHVHPLVRSAAPAMLPLHAPPPSPPKWCLLAPRGGHLWVPTLSLCSDGVLARRRLPFDARPVFCCHRGAGQRHRREARIGATTSPSRA